MPDFAPKAFGQRTAVVVSSAPAKRAVLAPIVTLPVTARNLRTTNPMATREARRFAVAAATRFRPSAAIEDISLLVGDLVNAAILADHRSVQLRVRRRGQGIRIEITGDPSTLDRYWPCGDVALVEAVAEKWGVFDTADEPATIWFDVLDEPDTGH